MPEFVHQIAPLQILLLRHHVLYNKFLMANLTILLKYCIAKVLNDNGKFEMFVRI